MKSVTMMWHAIELRNKVFKTFNSKTKNDVKFDDLKKSTIIL